MVDVVASPGVKGSAFGLREERVLCGGERSVGESAMEWPLVVGMSGSCLLSGWNEELACDLE